ncbi:MAG: TrkH family potassium uptake protein [Acidimicrobiia bacterium]
MAIRSRGWAAAPTPRRIFYIVGVVLIAGGLANLPALLVSLLYGETETALHFVISAAATGAAGAAVIALVGRPERLRPKDSFAGVAVAWVAVIAFGSLPFFLDGTLGFTDSIFESTAGYTTTGATAFEDLSAVSRGLLFWRATMQWLGGMGIIVLSIAVLPLVGAGGLQLARAEAPGPEPDRLTPRYRGTALRLWGFYAAFTGIVAVVLAVGDMSLFEAVAHALATTSTGGFSTESGSIGAFSPYTQWVVIVFMVIAGASFALHIRAMRTPAEYVRRPQFRYYITSLIIGIAMLMIALYLDGTGIPVREAIFTAIATITGTGFVVTNYAVFPAAALSVILLMMLTGGMSGSTTGALKTYRVAIVLKSAASEVRRLTRPRVVSISRFGKTALPRDVVSTVHTYVVVYVVAFTVGTVLVLYAQSAWGSEIDLVTGASAAASAIGNVGPGLGFVGPAGTYAGIAAPAKLILAALMILGRLEIYPVILLFTASFWRR